MIYLLLFPYNSLTIHPNKLLVATGQCAGHDRNDALVSFRLIFWIFLAEIFTEIADYSFLAAY